MDKSELVENQKVKEPPRIETANRAQLILRPQDLEATLPPDHKARLVWTAVERLELSPFYAKIEARGSEPGRPAIDPKILLALWLYATMEGEPSAREIARLCEEHDAYRWICGGVHVNHHTLSDFRVEHGAEMEGLMTQVLGWLIHKGLVRVERIAQDGMRVRADAGAASFHRERKLRESLEKARRVVEEVKGRGEEWSARQRAAKERAAREYQDRVGAALSELPKAREAKETEEEKEKVRVSTTDPEARVMHMADGGFRPAYNVQLATDTESRVIVGVGVTNVGSDGGQMAGMLEQVEKRTGKRPKEYLADGGFVNLKAITDAAEKGTTAFLPLPERGHPERPKAGDSQGVAAWRVRMQTEEAKGIYRERCATAETVNADLGWHRGLRKLMVRGLSKVRVVVVLYALAYNLRQWMSLDGLAGCPA